MMVIPQSQRSRTRKPLPAFLVVAANYRDIRAGRRGVSRKCGLALAANRALRQAGFLNTPTVVGCDHIYVTTRRTNKIAGTYRMTEAASAWVGRFDGGSTVTPETFTLELVVTP